MKYNYKDLLEGHSCCINCDNHLSITINEVDKLYCPVQDALVSDSGLCNGYEGFWRLINED